MRREPPLSRRGWRHWHRRALAQLGVPLLQPAAWAWVSWQQRRALRGGEPLGPAERWLARQVGVAEPQRVRVLVLPSMPVPAHALFSWLGEGLQRRSGRRWRLPCRLPWQDVDAITLGHAVLCIGAPPTPELLAHELRHVRQCEQSGSLWSFLGEYLRQVVVHGYRNAPFEVDARGAARAAMMAWAAVDVPGSTTTGLETGTATDPRATPRSRADRTA